MGAAESSAAEALDAPPASAADASPAATASAEPSTATPDSPAIEARHQRAATWQHRGQGRRTYLRAPWPPKVAGNAREPSASDSESESSTDPQPSISRTSSAARMKRTFSQASDCSELGSGTPDEAALLGSPDDPSSAAGSGTWPRLPKRSSRTRVNDAIDVWELTRALAREKSDLADQLARLTAGAEGGSEGGSTEGGPAASSSDGYPEQSYAYRSAASQDATMSDGSGRGGAGGGGGGSAPDFSGGLPGDVGSEARAKLDELVQAENQQQPGVDDGTLNSILGALQDQFKPDDEDEGGGGGGGGGSSGQAGGASAAAAGGGGAAGGAPAAAAHGPPPPGHYGHPAGPPHPGHPGHHPAYGYPPQMHAHGHPPPPGHPHAQHVHLSQLRGPPPGHGYPPHHAYPPPPGHPAARHPPPPGHPHHPGHPGPPPGHPHAMAHGPPPGYYPPHHHTSHPAAHHPPPHRPHPNAGLPPDQRGGHPSAGGHPSRPGPPYPGHHPHAPHGREDLSYHHHPGAMSHRHAAREAAKAANMPAPLHPQLPMALADAGNASEPSMPPPPPPLPRDSLQPHSSGGADVAEIKLGDDDSPLMLSAEQLCLYEGLFDDDDFLSHVEGSVNVNLHSPRMSAALGSVVNGEPLSPVLEAQPGLPSPSGSGDGLESPYGPGHLTPLHGAGLGKPLTAANLGGGRSGLKPPIAPYGHDSTPNGSSSRGGGAPSPAGSGVPGVHGGVVATPPAIERDSSSGGGSTNRKEWAAAEDELIIECVRNLGCKWRQIAAMLPGRSDDAVRNRWNRLKDPSYHSAAARDAAAGSATATAYRCSKCGQLKKNHRCTYVPPADLASGPPSTLPSPGGSSNVEGGGGSSLLEKDAAAGGAGSATPGGGGGGGGGSSSGPGSGGGGGGSEDKRKPERVGWKPEEDELITRSVGELGHKWFQIAERLPGRTDHAIRNRWHRLLTMRLDGVSQRQRSGQPDIDGLDAATIAAASAAAEHAADGLGDNSEALSLRETLDALTSDPMNALDLGSFEPESID